MSVIAARSAGGATTVSSVPGPVLLHLHRHVEHLERAGGVQPIHDDAEDLRVHVVDLALDDGDAIGCRARSAARPISTRSTFGVAGSSRSPAP